MKINVVWLMFIPLLVGSVIFLLPQFKYADSELIFEMKSARSSVGDVFWDSGSGHNEQDKSRFSVRQSSKFETYRVKVPAVGLSSIRIDPLDEEGTFEIRSVTLWSSDASYEWRGDSLCKSLAFHNVVKTSDCGELFCGRAITNDPVLVIAPIPNGGFKKNTSSRIIFAFCGAIAAFVLVFLVSWIPWSKVLFPLLFGASALFFIVSAFRGWSGSLLDLYEFRQTQTAISVSYLLKGGKWFAYETPIFGPPWTVPFEFPLYQWLVAATVKLTGLAIDQSGRFISLLCFGLLLIALTQILISLHFDKKVAFIVLSLTCLSPEYIFWSRAFMIESLSLALSAFYLLCYLKYNEIGISNRCRALYLVGSGLFGLLAATVKVTTFIAFAGLVCILIMLEIWRSFSAGKHDMAYMINQTVGALVFLLLPLSGLILWTRYADSLKVDNALTIGLISKKLHGWTFGSWRQKLSLKTWEVFYSRSIKDVIGSSHIAIVVWICSLFCPGKYLRTAWLSLICFLIPLTVFTNLHFVHSYYGYANGIFLLVAVGVVIAGLLDSENITKQSLGYGLLAFTIFSSVSHYRTSYLPLQGAAHKYEVMRQDFERLTPESDAILVFGNDWSSEIPYYLGRRGVMVTDSKDKQLKSGKASLTPGCEVSAILFCGKEKGRKVETVDYVMGINPSSYNNMVSYSLCDVYYRDVK